MNVCLLSSPCTAAGPGRLYSCERSASQWRSHGRTDAVAHILQQQQQGAGRPLGWLSYHPPPHAESWHCVQRCSNVTTFYSTLFLQRKWNGISSCPLIWIIISYPIPGMKGETSWFFDILWYSLWYLILFYWKSSPLVLSTLAVSNQHSEQ